MKSTISVVINTLNEQDNIVDAIESVKHISEDIVVVDMQSEDSTKDLAKKAGARVFDHERTGYVEPARNFAIEKAKNDWVLVLDADERIGKNLGKKLQKITQEDFHYVAVPRKNIIFGKWIKNSLWWPDYNIRFFKKGYVSWDEHIHSVPMTTGKGIDLPAKGRYAIKHLHYTTISQYIQRLDRYTSIQAKERKDEFDWKNTIRRPASEFLSRYFAGKGYKDGYHGLVLAGLQAVSEYIVELKIWELNKHEEKNLKSSHVVSAIREETRNLNYWLSHRMVESSGSFIEILRRKFKV